MRLKLLAALFAANGLLQIPVLGQSVFIPGFTGYAVPVEKSNEDDESDLFDPKSGLHHWTDAKQSISFYFLVNEPGQLRLALKMKAAAAGNKITVSLAGKSFAVTVPMAKQFATVAVGTVNIKQPGFYEIKISALAKPKGAIADLASIVLTGKPAQSIEFNQKERRNAASVHLMYPVPDSIEVVGFYNQITVPENADPLHSYYMACGFARGYFGMQVNSEQERRVIFSVWDAGSEAIDRNKVADSNRVKLRGRGEGVEASDFGNEGTGGHSHWVYPWKAGTTYSFYVTALPDSASQTTSYAGYFFVPELQRWKLIASFNAPRDGKYLHGLYSFVENFWGVNGQLYRKAIFGNGFIKPESGRMQLLQTAKFSTDATGRNGDRVDIGGGVEGKDFYLWNGGFRKSNAKYGDLFYRDTGALIPTIDLYRNVDSVVQAQKDQEAILSAIRAGKFDTTASVQGIFYKILKEGNGRSVAVTDTVVANYKGSLLNGEIFDQTKTSPATFPLARLIKGWQIGLQRCKVGGSIRLIIPSALAYSIRDRGYLIPPNQVLVFDIEVLSVK